MSTFSAGDHEPLGPRHGRGPAHFSIHGGGALTGLSLTHTSLTQHNLSATAATGLERERDLLGQVSPLSPVRLDTSVNTVDNTVNASTEAIGSGEHRDNPGSPHVRAAKDVHLQGHEGETCLGEEVLRPHCATVHLKLWR